MCRYLITKTNWYKNQVEFLLKGDLESRYLYDETVVQTNKLNSSEALPGVRTKGVCRLKSLNIVRSLFISIMLTTFVVIFILHTKGSAARANKDLLEIKAYDGTTPVLTVGSITFYESRVRIFERAMEKHRKQTFRFNKTTFCSCFSIVMNWCKAKGLATTNDFNISISITPSGDIPFLVSVVHNLARIGFERFLKEGWGVEEEKVRENNGGTIDDANLLRQNTLCKTNCTFYFITNRSSVVSAEGYVTKTTTLFRIITTIWHNICEFVVNILAVFISATDTNGNLVPDWVTIFTIDFRDSIVPISDIYHKWFAQNINNMELKVDMHFVARIGSKIIIPTSQDLDHLWSSCRNFNEVKYALHLYKDDKRKVLFDKPIVWPVTHLVLTMNQMLTGPGI